MRTIGSVIHPNANYIECRPAGISVNADVSFNTRPMESSWELFYLARKPAPRWNERSRLARVDHPCVRLTICVMPQNRADKGKVRYFP